MSVVRLSRADKSAGLQLEAVGGLVVLSSVLRPDRRIAMTPHDIEDFLQYLADGSNTRAGTFGLQPRGSNLRLLLMDGQELVFNRDEVQAARERARAYVALRKGRVVTGRALREASAISDLITEAFRQPRNGARAVGA